MAPVYHVCAGGIHNTLRPVGTFTSPEHANECVCLWIDSELGFENGVLRHDLLPKCVCPEHVMAHTAASWTFQGKCILIVVLPLYRDVDDWRKTANDPSTSD